MLLYLAVMFLIRADYFSQLPFIATGNLSAETRNEIIHKTADL
jgi:hypothetical protein